MEKVAEAIREHAAAVRLLAEAVMHNGSASANRKLPEFARPAEEALPEHDVVIQAIIRSVEHGGQPEEVAGYTTFEVQRIAATRGYFSSRVGSHDIGGTGPALDEHWNLKLL